MRRKLVSSDDHVLNSKATPVDDPASVRQLAADLTETMVAEGGVGIAAPQVGEGIRLFVVAAGEQKLVCVNPKLLSVSEEEIPWEEGCLSLPRLLGEVIRPKEVELEFTTLEGSRTRLSADGLLARVIQHELDHLDGILFPARMTDSSKVRKISEAEWHSRFESADKAPE